MGLDIALVHHLRLKFPLQHQIGLAKALFDVAFVKIKMSRDVAGLFGMLSQVGGVQVVMKELRAFLHGGLNVHHRRELLVFDFYLPDGFSYCSDSNDRWLTVDELKAILEEG